MEQLQQLKQKRGQIKATLTRSKKVVEQLDVLNITTKVHCELRLRLNKIISLLDQFSDLQSQIELLDDPAAAEANEIERENYENDYYSLCATIEDLLQNKVHLPENTSNQSINAGVRSQLNEQNEINSELQINSDSIQNNGNNVISVDSANSSNKPVTFANSIQVQLPIMKLPTFSGNYTKWVEFKDSFEALVGSNASLSDVQKLHHLRSCLDKDVLETIQSIPISGTNYAIAWDALKERYEKGQLIIRTHVRAILDFPRLVKESPKELRNLYNTISNNLQALRALGEPIDQWNTLLIHILTDKLDNVTKREWELFCAKQHTYTAVNDKKSPTIDDLYNLIKIRCDFLEKLDISKPHSSYFKSEARNKIYSTAHAATSKMSCFYCKRDHTIYKCDKFLAHSPTVRYDEAQRLRLCINCLRANHNTAKCQASTCRKCKKPHNTLLHFDAPTRDVQNNSFNAEADTFIHNTSTHHTVQPENTVCNIATNTQVLLSTIIVLVEDSKGKMHKCRALLDSGSMSNFLSEEFCRKLNLSVEKVQYSISGVGHTTYNVQGSVNFKIRSQYNSFNLGISCLVLPQVTVNLPLRSFNKDNLQLPRDIMLADPTFNESRQVDLLLGSAVFWDVLRTGQRRLSNHLSLQNTNFGYIIVGSIQLPSQGLTTASYHSALSLEQQVAKFWEVEEIHPKSILSSSEQYCENHFQKTVARAADGRFIVTIPFKDHYKDLGHSREYTLKRFYSQEQRLIKQPKLLEEYTRFMQEYISLGHMVEVTESNNREELNYYIPHHAVVKESSSTTKVRVVFDASMKTDSGLSLNDVQHIGPTIQNDLLSIILRFRMHRYVMTADIAKMYRMILINADQRKFHRIFWRNKLTDDLKCYELQTVSYGTSSAAYLAIRCLHELALEYMNSKPLASEAIKNNFYVDDFLHGSDSRSELVQVQHDVTAILASAGLHLRKWLTNDRKLGEEFQVATDFESSVLSLGPDETNKTLGICWNSTSDNIEYSNHFSPISARHRVTKRSILSEISRIFDPLGLLGPVIVVAKLMIQTLWQERISWDDEIPKNIKDQWDRFHNDLRDIKEIKIPRQVTVANYVRIELHGFGDASQRAYGACIYIRSTMSNGQFYSQLLCAKSKVAPIKQISLPRLELCSALLLAQLVNKVCSSLTIQFDKHYLWTDSTVTLAWIRAPPNRWKTFVANRVSEIQHLTRIEDWNHITSRENPADMISRGASARDIKNSIMWWSGPSWLLSKLPISRANKEIEDNIPEQRTVTCAVINNNFGIFDRFSTLSKLQRVVAYCIRFISNCKVAKESRSFKALTVRELDASLTILISITQRESFPLEYKDLSDNISINTKSRLMCLDPFMDGKLIRVGGRLENSHCDFSKKHPIVLPNKHKFTRLVFENEHLRLAHCGPTMLLSSVRERYWPISGRNLARGIVRNCITCFRAKPKPTEYIMGNLPESRVNQYMPFYNTGVDYAGPFLLKDRSTRGAKIIKGYICLFICLSTKAIHLELVSDLSSQCFLACLKRFIGRRGKPLNIYSDNGKNFVGACAEIKRFYSFLGKESENICNFLARDAITWHFIPARSPSFGGIWEAGIKSMKYHVKRVIGNAHLHFEDFLTILIQIESVLNSRPLCPLTSNPDDLDPLTPGHFLIGRSLTSLPEPDYTNIPENRLKRYQRLQQIIQHFWSRWHKDYLCNLQTRVKWRRSVENGVALGSAVLLMDDNLPPMQWRLGRITALHPGKDGVVRVVSVKVKDGIVKRSVARICILPNMTITTDT